MRARSREGVGVSDTTSRRLAKLNRAGPSRGGQRSLSLLLARCQVARGAAAEGVPTSPSTRSCSQPLGSVGPGSLGSMGSVVCTSGFRVAASVALASSRSSWLPRAVWASRDSAGRRTRNPGHFMSQAYRSAQAGRRIGRRPLATTASRRRGVANRAADAFAAA